MKLRIAKPKSVFVDLMLTLLLLLSIAAVTVVVALIESWQLRPPEGSGDLKSFAATMPPPRALRIVGDGDEKSVVWVGRTASILALPSGPSCYVFDSTGRLEAWAPMTGDGSVVDAKLNACRGRPAVTLEEAIRLVSKSTAR